MCVTLAMPVCTRILDNRSDFSLEISIHLIEKSYICNRKQVRQNSLYPILSYINGDKKRVVDNSTEKPTVVE